MKNSRFKIFILLTLLSSFAFGCSKDLRINTEYDSVKIVITNVMNDGCYSDDDDTYFTHNIHDEHIYEFDYENNVEYIKTDHWVGYNFLDKQFISSDSGKTYISSNELTSEIFDKKYQDDLLVLLEYISTSEKINVVEQGKETKFTADFKGHENEVFEIIKKFGTINKNDKLKTLDVSVTVFDSDVTKIVFDIVSTNEIDDIDSCYKVEWKLSDFNEISIKVPNDIN